MIEFELNSAGVRELLKSKEMAGIIEEYTSKVANNAGENFKASTSTLSTRVVGRVSPANIKGYNKNRKENTLLKALHD